MVPGAELKSEIIMMGKREKVIGWKGQLYVAIVKEIDGIQQSFKVVCDSTDEGDVKDLPETKVFKDKMEALSYAMEMERNKKNWKTTLEKM